MNTTFFVVPTSNQFQIKLGLSWLNAMHVVASPIHKCLKFFHDEEVKMGNHSLYHTSRLKDCATIDFFWPSLPNSCPTQPDHLFHSYQVYKQQIILELSLPPMDINHGLFPTPSIPHLSMSSKSINQDPTIACSSPYNPSPNL